MPAGEVSRLNSFSKANTTAFNSRLSVVVVIVVVVVSDFVFTSDTRVVCVYVYVCLWMCVEGVLARMSVSAFVHVRVRHRRMEKSEHTHTHTEKACRRRSAASRMLSFDFVPPSVCPTTGHRGSSSPQATSIRPIRVHGTVAVVPAHDVRFPAG